MARWRLYQARRAGASLCLEKDAADASDPLHVNLRCALVGGVLFLLLYSTLLARAESILAARNALRRARRQVPGLHPSLRLNTLLK